jgi:RecG-like helicase
VAERRPNPVVSDFPFTHFEPNVKKIAEVKWRQRSHVVGQVVSITSDNSHAHSVNIELWDSTGGISLQFLGRTQLLGVKVGTYLKAEGMVGEEDGKLTMMNPRYEIML